MGAEKGRAALDRFRLAAAVLVVCNHTSPLASLTAAGDFWLTRVLARTAVPFFLMVTGYFLAQGGWRGTGRFWKKTLLTYGAAVLLYLPLNWYSGGYSPLEWGRRLLVEGTLYHLWYFPAVLLGVLIARGLSRLGTTAALSIGALLYLVGMGGDSCWGLVSALPGLRGFYEAVFSISSHTRNGLFYAPLFLLLGAAAPRWSRRRAAAGTLCAQAALTLEGFALRALGWPRHDSMYASLPLTMVFLFSLLLGENRGEDRRARRLSLLLYLLHPWAIVLVRFGAELAGLEGPLVEHSLGHFLAVLALTLLGALALEALRPLRPHLRGRAWREVDLEALAHNARTLQGALAPGCRLMAVVKADAYGHGALLVCRRLRREGVSAFAVATLAEGIALRKGGVLGTILILGCTPPEEALLLRRWRLTQTVASLDHGRALEAQGIPLRVHLALDTGMHRLGVPAEDGAALEALFQLKHLKIGGVFSHLCLSDSGAEEDAAFTQGQLARFYAAAEDLRRRGYDPGALHIQASYGVLNLPPQPCAFARAGIALYGVGSGSAPVRFPLDLRPVLSLRARVVLVRSLAQGEGAGYGLAFRAERETILAVASIGYADGLPRDLPQRGGRVLIRGTFCPMVGRMCMDQLLVDVTGLPAVRPGDTVTLIGRDGGEELRAEEGAERCGTITNELLSRLGGRLPLLPV